jgi:mRNA-degrading endonuclease RelE of RelBE toxin-antitoxin system
LEIEYSEYAAKALLKMDRATQEVFTEQIEKMADMPPRRHLQFGQPYNVEKVWQVRIVYQIEGNTMFVTRCFATHKEYEK